jgi:hypothetical protein
MRTPNHIRQLTSALVVAAGVLSGASCSDMARTGTGPAFLIMENVTAARGGGTDFTSNLLSDVLTIVNVTVGGATVPTPTIFNDLGQASIRAEMKNQLATTSPTPVNSITLNRYRVRFRRTDGQNREGIDIPYGFDGGTTANIQVGVATTINFDLVRHQTKTEPPLRNLINGGGLRFISVIAEVTFYGADQAGNEVSVTGSIDVQFGDFGDS